MTRERALELAEWAVKGYIADAIMIGVAEEREACAKIADGQREQAGNTPDWYCACGCIADEIRERGK